MIIGIQALIFMLFIPNAFWQTLMLALIMATLFFVSDKSDFMKFGGWAMIGLFLVYHFFYGFYRYNNAPTQTVCGTFVKFETLQKFKEQKYLLVLYAKNEGKFYKFAHITRLHERTDFFENRYAPAQNLCIDYVSSPAFTMTYPYILKNVQVLDN